MAEYTCENCGKKFGFQEALDQHNKDKHTIQEKPKRQINKNKAIGAAVILLIILAVVYTQISKPSYTPLTQPTPHVKGNGTIDVVEFSDFQCPFCGQAYTEAKKIVEQYSDKVKFTYKHFPLTNIHTFAFKAAEASECAADQGKFWEYHDKLFENQKNLELRDLKQYAADTGLDTEKFNACLDSGAMSSRVSNDQAEGRTKGVEATPTFFVNGQIHEGTLTLEKFKQITSI